MEVVAATVGSLGGVLGAVREVLLWGVLGAQGGGQDGQKILEMVRYHSVLWLGAMFGCHG